MCMCVILLESLSRSFCCAVSNVAARILDEAMAIPTVMAHLVSLLHRIVAWLIAHRYILHQCAYVLFYLNRFPGHFVLLFSMLQHGFWCQRWWCWQRWRKLSFIGMYSINVHLLFYLNCTEGCFVVIFCRFAQDFGTSDGDFDNAPCRPSESNYWWW